MLHTVGSSVYYPRFMKKLTFLYNYNCALVSVDGYIFPPFTVYITAAFLHTSIEWSHFIYSGASACCLGQTCNTAYAKDCQEES
jgi:hypothetical protein